MQFYQVTMLRDTQADPTQEYGNYLSTQSGSFCCVKKADRNTVTLLAAADWQDSVEAVIAAWKYAAGFFGSVQSVRELPAPEFAGEVESVTEDTEDELLSGRVHEIGLEAFAIPPIAMSVKCAGTEMPMSKRALHRCCRENALTALDSELTRIFSASASKTFLGHPVHYALMGEEDTDTQLDVLLTALRTAHRLRSTQTMTLNIYRFRIPEEVLKNIYRMQRGGSVVISLETISEMQHECDDDWRENIKTVLKLSHRYRNSVLTVLTAPQGMEDIVRSLTKKLPNMSFVTLDDEKMPTKKAQQYAEKLLGELHAPNVSARELLMPKQDGYTRVEVRAKVDAWQHEMLCAEAYPAYETLVMTEKKADERKAETEKEKDALSELENLIGLSEAKKIVRQAIDFNRAQKLFAQRGFPVAKPGMHMVFTGNPGTAKTTVARLVGQICRQYGLLPKGELIEVGRKDLVGRYVGWTAKNVEAVFRRARGNVLFIDEAYSLLDDKRGLFGDEAINTIVQQMENVREDTIVIFAGYPEQMETLLDRNEGLRSRISFHVAFPDYSEDELCEIFRKFIAEQGREIDLRGEQRVRAILRDAMENANFGNGRFVRSLVEKALMQQACRLMGLPEAQITEEKIRLLLPEDLGEAKHGEAKRICLPIGFAG